MKEVESNLPAPWLSNIPQPRSGNLGSLGNMDVLTSGPEVVATNSRPSLNDPD